MMFKNVKELVQLTEERNTSISEIMIVQEMEVTGKSREEIFSQMYRSLINGT
ncbi:serine dehydratase [Bacillus safensis FO-36b] [Bacillus safensis subsp. safensis]